MAMLISRGNKIAPEVKQGRMLFTLQVPSMSMMYNRVPSVVSRKIAQTMPTACRAHTTLVHIAIC